MIVRILLRRDVTENWVSVNPILGTGEVGIENCVDGTRKLKLGNGTDAWVDLPYFIDRPISVDQFEAHVTNINDAHGATAVPTADKIAKYNSGKGLQSDKAPVEYNDVVRKYELDAEALERGNLDNQLTQEITERTTADTNLQTQIDTINSGLAKEITDRTDADADLQNQIDDLSSIISIRGSVDTYAHLPDPTTLSEGVAYIVEEDENYNGTTSIYEVVDNAGVLEWAYIAKFTVDLTEYYTKDEVDVLVDSKVDTAELDNYYDKTETDNLLNALAFNLLIVPDYSNIETINRITANGGTWTVESSGFVYCGFNAHNVCRAYVNINGINVSSAICANIAQVIQHADVFPVFAGDVITMGASPNNINSYTCYFIPPRGIV